MYDENEAKNITHLVIEEKLGWGRASFMLRKDEAISEVKANELTFFLLRLLKGEPVQYVLGYAFFDDLKLKVNPSVLIPRPETEELVDWIIEENKGHKGLNILDIGTGSGCIALALKRNLPEANVHALDISEKALLIAEENAIANDTDVHFFRYDILASIPTPQIHSFELDAAWDIIVSNPPYIPDSEKGELHKNVVEYEPHEALFVTGDDPLIYYKAIASFADKNLENHGTIYFEIHEEAASNMRLMLEEHGFKNVVIHKDLSNKNRMVKAQR